MFEDWIRELRSRSVGRLGRAELCDVVEAAARLRAAVDALEGRALTAIDELDDAGAPASTVARAAGRTSQRDADRRARRAATLDALPEAADALAEGRLSSEHVDILGRALEATSRETVRASGLVEAATRRPADLCGRDVRNWIRRTQDDHEVEAVQRRRRAARGLSLFENDDGMTVLHAELDPVAGAEVRSALDAEADRLFHADGGRGGASEVRTPTQRRADALTGLITRPPSAAAPGASPSVRHQFLVVATLQQGSISVGRTADGSPLPPSEIERLACGSDLWGLVLSGSGDPLWHGRRVRLATDAQWRALISRDGGCVICGLAAARCQAHHLVPWQPPSRGPTDIDNLVLLCGHHHHLAHDRGLVLHRGSGGWTLRPP